jgi:hypothetical protein
MPSNNVCRRTWYIGIKEINMLAVWDRKILRIFGPVMEDKWRSRINIRLTPTHTQQKLVREIKSRRLG